MTKRCLTGTPARFLVAMLAIGACAPLSNASPSPNADPTAIPVAAASPTSSPTFAPEPTIVSPADVPSKPPAAVGEVEFVRWNSRRVTLVTEPGGSIGVEHTGDEPIAAVLDRRVVDGMEWIRVQVGRGYAQDSVVNGWAPYAADVREDGQTVHVEPVYEFIEPDCPDGAPTVLDLDAMLPLQALYCFGSQTLSFSPIQVRDEGSEEASMVEGTPEWLAEGGNLVMYWLPERREYGSIRSYVDPAAGIEVPLHVWVEVTGHLDDKAAQTCTRSSEYPEFDVANQTEAIQICRSRFVVTGVRRLSEAEIPPAPPLPSAEPVAGTVQVDLITTHSPAAARAEPTTVWTGSELLVWGGWDASNSKLPLFNDGLAYQPSTGVWREIAAAPINGRWGALSTWTGSELLVWGGNETEDVGLSDGAAYDPATDTWRRIADGPLQWKWRGASTWTGAEWWIAAEQRGGSVDVAAYAPATDSWRSLPSIADEYADTPAIAWTGSEILLLTAAGLFEMKPDGSEWIAQDAGLREPALWTGDLLVGMGDVPTSDDPLSGSYLSLPMGWDPVAGERVALPTPPRSVYEPILAGTHLAFFESGLALDLTTGRWLELEISRKGQAALEMVDATTVWAGDRLVAWGGEDPCFGPSADTDVVQELMPDWSTANGSATASDLTNEAAAQRRFAC